MDAQKGPLWMLGPWQEAWSPGRGGAHAAPGWGLALDLSHCSHCSSRQTQSQRDQPDRQGAEAQAQLTSPAAHRPRSESPKSRLKPVRLSDSLKGACGSLIAKELGGGAARPTPMAEALWAAGEGLGLQRWSHPLLQPQGLCLRGETTPPPGSLCGQGPHTWRGGDSPPGLAGRC